MKYTKILSAAVLLSAMAACTDESTFPIPSDEIKNGAFARQIAVTEGTYNLFDLSNSNFVVTIEVVDEKGGALLQSYDFYATFQDKSTDNGTVSKPETLIKSFPASAFTNDPISGFPRATLSVNAAEVMAALGITEEQVTGGDVFALRQELKLTTGQVFTNSNSHGELTGGQYFKTPFYNLVPVVCPSALAGNYTVTSATGTSTDGCCLDPVSTSGATVTLTDADNVGFYEMSDFSGGIYAGLWYGPAYGLGSDEVSAIIVDACGKISINDTEPYGQWLTATGTLDSETGVISYDWENGWGDSGSVVLTPQ
jgi:hypothetical protein